MFRRKQVEADREMFASLAGTLEKQMDEVREKVPVSKRWAEFERGLEERRKKRNAFAAALPYRRRLQLALMRFHHYVFLKGNCASWCYTRLSTIDDWSDKTVEK